MSHKEAQKAQKPNFYAPFAPLCGYLHLLKSGCILRFSRHRRDQWATRPERGSLSLLATRRHKQDKPCLDGKRFCSVQLAKSVARIPPFQAVSLQMQSTQRQPRSADSHVRELSHSNVHGSSTRGFCARTKLSALRWRRLCRERVFRRSADSCLFASIRGLNYD